MGPGFKTCSIGMEDFGLKGLEDEVFVVFDDGSLSTEELEIKRVVSMDFFVLI